VTLKRNVFSWLLFDFCQHLVQRDDGHLRFSSLFQECHLRGQSYGDALWGAAISISMLLVAVVSPVLGASADYSGRRKRFLFSFTLLSVVATALLSFAGPGMAVFAVLLFIMANIGFEGGLVFL